MRTPSPRWLLSLTVPLIACSVNAPPDAVATTTQAITPVTDVAVSSFGSTAFAADLTSYEHWYGGGSIGLTPWLSLQTPTSDKPIEVAFRSPFASTTVAAGQTFEAPAELMLFTREPEEHRDTLWKATLGEWRALLSTPRLDPLEEQTWMTDFGLPASVVVPFRGNSPTWQTLSPVDPQLFWTTDLLPTQPSSWTAPGTGPVGWGSIKTMLAQSFAPCGAALNLEHDLVVPIKAELGRQLLSQAGSTGLGNRVDRVSLLGLGLSSTLTPPEDFTGAGTGTQALGGLMLKGDAQVEVTVIGAPVHCEVAFQTEYRFSLDDGYFAMVPTRWEFSDQGADSVCATFRPKLEAAMLTEIPARVHQQAAARQKFDFGDASNDLFGCVDLGDPASPTPVYTCEKAATFLEIQAQAGAASFLGVPVAQVPAAWRQAIHDAIFDGAAQPDGAKNWSCGPRFSKDQESICRPKENRCLFNLRAHVIRSTPDEASLEWFRSFDPTLAINPRVRGPLALFFAALQSGSTGALCSRATPAARDPSDPAANAFNRYFATGYQKAVSSSNDAVRAPDVCCEGKGDPVCGSGACDETTHLCRAPSCWAHRDCLGDEVCVGVEFWSAGSCQRIPQPSTACDPNFPFKAGACPAGTMCYPRVVDPRTSTVTGVCER